MRFALTEDQRLLQDSIGKALEQFSPLERVRRFADGGEPAAPDIWAGLADLGLPGLIIPEEHGGLGRQRGLHHAEAKTAMLLSDQQAGQAKLGQAAPEVGRGLLLLVGEPPHPLQRRERLQRLGDAGLQQLLVLGKCEPHDVQAFAALGSRGMPRPRSEMMFFWIWAVPPPMIRPRSNM